MKFLGTAKARLVAAKMMQILSTQIPTCPAHKNAKSVKSEKLSRSGEIIIRSYQDNIIFRPFDKKYFQVSLGSSNQKKS